ncbi:MAG TPA: hypothetical protein VGI10_06665 [Polyangiaceae bacterium]
MAQLAFAIPEPIPSDPETVVTALETAAVFGAKGDAGEAMRWVRHAATSAGETGRDSRALELARAASEMGAPVSQRQRSPSSLPLPPPPPRPISQRPPPVAEVNHTLASRPPPPSDRSRPSAFRPSQPASVARATNASSHVDDAVPTPRAGRVEASAPPSARTSAPPSARSSVAPAATAPRALHGARVSIAAGSEPGVFELRVLPPSATPEPRALEAFIVLVDPRADLSSLDRARR